MSENPPAQTTLQGNLKRYLRFKFLFADLTTMFDQGITSSVTRQKLDELCHNLGEESCLAVFIFIFFGLEPPIEIHQASLLEVFLADLSKPPPGFDVD